MRRIMPSVEGKVNTAHARWRIAAALDGRIQGSNAVFEVKLPPFRSRKKQLFGKSVRQPAIHIIYRLL